MSAALDDAQRAPAWLQVFWGGLIVAVADIAFAITVWFTWSVSGLIKVFQAIAVGVLGKASYDGGVVTALLGAGLQLFMATMFVVAYTLAGRRVPALLHKPLVYGPLYGVVLYVIMNFMVMPLSRVGATPSFERIDRIIAVVVAHMVFGVICVLFARRALRQRKPA